MQLKFRVLLLNDNNRSHCASVELCTRTTEAHSLFTGVLTTEDVAQLQQDMRAALADAFRPHYKEVEVVCD